MIIDEITFEENIKRTYFACDIEKCKGACCTLDGGRGAPLLDEELQEIENAFPIIKKYLPEKHLATIKKYGLYEGNPGKYATQCVENKACVFVYYENDIALCAFEKAFLQKEISWQKPLSCHLFPIRINRVTQTAFFEYCSVCSPALEKGTKEHILLEDFLEKPLQRITIKKQI